MVRNVLEINWHYIGDAVPAFLTLIILPLTYNIAYGVIAGVLSYLLINGIPYILKKVSNGRIIPPDYNLSEEWVIPPGGVVPHWILRLLGRTPPSLEYQLEEEHAEKGAEGGEHVEKEEPKSVVESLDRSSKES